MKKFIAMICSLLFVFQVMDAQDEVTQDVKKLPVTAREFIKKQFPETSISYFKIDKDLFSAPKYDVKLADGMEIEFDSQGEWTEIDCKPRAVPSSLIPNTIMQYMKQQYANHHIVKIERDRKGYELTLDNGLEVEFDQYGGFIKLND